MSSDYKKQILATNLKRQIERTGLDRAQVCALVGVKYNAMCEWLMGHNYPRVDTLDKLARFFGIRVTELTEEQTPDEIRASALLSVFYDLSADDQRAVLAFATYRLEDQKREKNAKLREKFDKEWAEDHGEPKNAREKSEKEYAFTQYLEKAKDAD